VSEAGQLATSLAGERPAVLLLDPALQEDRGERLLAEHSGLPVAMLVGRDAAGSESAAMHRAAFDYLTWPVDPRRLQVILAHAFERHRLLERIRRLEVLAAPAADEADGTLRAIDRMEKRAIVDALRRAEGNVRQAARLLGLGQATVYRKVKRYKIPLGGRGRTPTTDGSLTPRPSDAARSVG
jgi:DNA-binding NtrC family response regulator